MQFCKDCKHYLGRGVENIALAKCELIGKNRTRTDYCSRFVDPETGEEQRVRYQCEWKFYVPEWVWVTQCDSQFEGENGMEYCPNCSAKIKYL